jgi:uncharacterized protein (TIGR03435 family)
MRNVRAWVWVVGVALVCGGALQAQETDLAGTWQGTTVVSSNASGKEMRMLLKISRSAGAGWQGILYNLDSNLPSRGMTVSQVSLHGTDFAFAVASGDGSYEGKMSGDGALIVGTWTQAGKDAQALTLARANAETAWAVPEPNKVMPVDADPVLEVATIKPTDPSMITTNDSIGFQGRLFKVQNKTVEFLLTFAYGLQKQQLVGVPGWLSTDKYDVEGTPDVEGQPSIKQMQALVRKLLAERFHLETHWDKKEMSVYALTVTKAGPKMTKNLGDPNGLPNQNGGRDANGRVDKYSNATMKDFAFILQFFLDKPVVDQTGLTGRFDFVLRWLPNDASVASLADPATASPGMFTAVQEQLGLKIEAVRAPADVLVIDRVERPSEN